jgi:sugar transferase (PEP-CTERM/EpsH1 system associated)
MKILVLASNIPATTNMPGSPRLFSLCRGLSLNHSLTLVTLCQSQERYQTYLDDPLAEGVFKEIIVLPATPTPTWWRRHIHKMQQEAHFVTRYRSPEYFIEQCNKIRNIFKQGSFDIIFVDGLIMAQYVMDKPEWPAVIDLHDSLTLLYARATKVEPNLFRRMQLHSETKSIQKWEKNLSRVFSAIITNSNVDETFIKQLDPSAKTRTIGNGVDSEYFGSNEKEVDRYKLVFTGVMNYNPNEDAAIYFCNDILPLIQESYPEVQFWIVGKDPTEKVLMLAKRPGVYVTGGVKDIRPYVESASIFVSPIRYGAGIKNKILAALAMKKAIVATHMSIEGLDLDNNQDLLTADEPKDFADQVIKLLEDRELAEQLGHHGQAKVRSNYSWATSTLMLNRILEEAAKLKH